MDKKSIGKGTFDISPRKEFFDDTKEKRQSLPRQKRKYNRTFRITDEEGICKTYSMDKRVSYADFICWPRDIQIKYLTDIVNRYPSITVAAIANMMNCCYKTFRKININLGNIIPIGKSGSPYRTTKENIDQFYKDFGVECVGGECKNSVKKEEKENDSIHINSMSMEVSFNIDADDIVKVLKDHGFTGEVTITIKKNIGN